MIKKLIKWFSIDWTGPLDTPAHIDVVLPYEKTFAQVWLSDKHQF